MNEVLIKPGVWAIIKLMPVKVLPLWNMWFFPGHVYPPALHLFPFWQPQKGGRDERYGALNHRTVTRMFFLKRKMPEKELSPLFFSDGKSGGFKIGIIWTCTVCFLPSHSCVFSGWNTCDVIKPLCLPEITNHPALLLTDDHSCALIVGEHIRRNVSAGTFFFPFSFNTYHSSLVMWKGERQKQWSWPMLDNLIG